MSSFRVNTNIMALNALGNVGATSDQFSKSMNRLSTGLRINSAADDPAGLIASESFRAQISGVTQAIQNSQDALNYAKTAEGALDEVGKLLRDGRTLAVASANSGALSTSQLQANQTQWNLIVSSINRIADQTQFGTKKLLNGSAGVNAMVVNSSAIRSMSIGGEIGTSTITADGSVSVAVTAAAAKATTTGTRQVAVANQAAYLAASVGAAAGSFAINGNTFTVSATDTWGQVIDKVNRASGQTGVVADVVDNTGSFSMRLTSVKYGSNAKVNLVDANGVLLSAAGNAAVTGTNAVASVTVGALPAQAFTGGQMGNDGLTLTDSRGNRIVLNEAGNAVATYANAGQVMVGSAQFQVGGNAGQTASLSLGNFAASTLGIDALDMTSASGASAAISAIDAAIDDLNRKRGEMGSFMSNSLESNIRSLRVAQQTLTATESSIRDTDVAAEMTNLTRLQILQQSGMAVLGQANKAPQAVLSLLQG